jgi:hypothetical protein
MRPPIAVGLLVTSIGGNRGTVLSVLRSRVEHTYAFEIRLESGEVASFPIKDWGSRWLPLDAAKGDGQ